VRTAAQIIEEFEQVIERLVLIPSSGGRFEVVVDDRLVYSKEQTGRHPEYEEIAGPIREILA
jgi:selenoprotein W-related protein